MQIKSKVFRTVRLNDRSYWKDEGFSFNPEIAENIKNIDVVVSHICPNFAEPINFGPQVDYWHNFEKGLPGNSRLNLKEELKQERLFMAHIYTTLKSNKNPITHWFISRRQVYEGINFILLDIDEWYDVNS